MDGVLCGKPQLPVFQEGGGIRPWSRSGRCAGSGAWPYVKNLT